MFQEFLLVKEVTKFLKEIQAKNIHIVDWADKICLEFLYLTTNVVFLICWILVDKEVVEQISIFWVLEPWAVQFIVEFLYCHTSCFLCFLSGRVATDKLRETTVRR